MYCVRFLINGTAVLKINLFYFSYHIIRYDFKYFFFKNKKIGCYLKKQIIKSIYNFQWSLMLRSISSFRAFKWAYGSKEINSNKIIDFLVLSMMCPRSLIFSIEKINHHLVRLEKFYNRKNSKEIRISRFYENFKKLNVNKILEIGLHIFLKKFIKDLSTFYVNLEQKYFIGIKR